MPIYEYRCDCGALTEQMTFSWRDRQPEVRCGCGGRARLVPSVPARAADEKALLNAQEMWAGTPWEGTDGVNPELYARERAYSGA